jgi:hypothetical protein
VKSIFLPTNLFNEFWKELLDISYRIVILSGTIYLFSFVISHFEAKFRNHEFRKLSSFLVNPVGPDADLMLPFTNVDLSLIFEVEDYGSKVSIMFIRNERDLSKHPPESLHSVKSGNVFPLTLSDFPVDFS